MASPPMREASSRGDRVVLPESVVGVGSIALPRSTSHRLLIAARPRQWTKNLLVIAAPGAAGMLSQPSVLAHAAIAFLALAMCASATYLVNDVLDAPWDAQTGMSHGYGERLCRG